MSASRTNGQHSGTSPDAGTTHVRILIVGSGFAGMGMAIRLKKSGIDDFAVLERAGEVGGTWRDNHYPGAACDVPSHLYSFSFAPNPHWSRSFSPQGEIQEYLRRCCDDFGVRPHIHFDEAVLSARWDEAENLWQVATSRGEWSARFLLSATGALSDPSIPDIAGLDSFTGKVFHSASWDHGYDLSGKRVAVIGTGASAIQFVPQVQPVVGRLTVFQRTPPWIMPRHDRSFTALERLLFRRLPALQQFSRSAIYWSREMYVLGFAFDQRVMAVADRIARRHLRRQIPDPGLRSKLTPGYTIGCKRILISNDYLPSLSQPNVDVVTAGIGEVREHSVVTTTGQEIEVDAIIFGTGFHVTDLPVAAHITGRSGVTLREYWKEGMHAHKGTAVPGFPNLFLLVGPNTGLGHTSQVYMIECQIAYVMDALRRIGERAVEVVEVREEAEARWNDSIQAQMKNTVWTSGGCASWYLDEHGRNTTLWPGFTWQFRRRTRSFDAESFEFAMSQAAPVASSPTSRPVVATR